MAEYRDATGRRIDPDLVEEVVEEPGEQVVRRTRTVAASPLAGQSVTTETVAEAPRPVRRRWWRRTSVPAAATEYYAVPTYGGDPVLAQFVRVMWFVLGVLETLLALRFVLALLGANPGNAFASLIYGATGPFVWPFRSLFATPSSGGAVFEFYTLIAMAVYFLLWWGIVRFVEVVTNRRVDV